MLNDIDFKALPKIEVYNTISTLNYSCDAVTINVPSTDTTPPMHFPSCSFTPI